MKIYSNEEAKALLRLVMLLDIQVYPETTIQEVYFLIRQKMLAEYKERIK